MKIGIIGTGPMGRYLGGRWAQQNHNVFFASHDRDAERAAVLAAEIEHGSRSGTYAEAAAFGDVILLAVEWERAVAVARELAPALSGKVLLDCNDPGSFEQIDTLAVPHRSLAEAIADAAPGAAVVKLFNTVAADDIRRTSDPIFNVRERPTTFCCGDDPDALQIARSLADEIGFETVNVGPLRNARHLESLAGLAACLTTYAAGFELAVRHHGNW